MLKSLSEVNSRWPESHKGGERAGGMAEVTECLHSKYKTLNSNPTTLKKKK
jgi:hypothetical protein